MCTPMTSNSSYRLGSVLDKLAHSQNKKWLDLTLTCWERITYEKTILACSYLCCFGGIVYPVLCLHVGMGGR